MGRAHCHWTCIVSPELWKKGICLGASVCWVHHSGHLGKIPIAYTHSPSHALYLFLKNKFCEKHCSWNGKESNLEIILSSSPLFKQMYNLHHAWAVLPCTLQCTLQTLEVQSIHYAFKCPLMHSRSESLSWLQRVGKSIDTSEESISHNSFLKLHGFEI